MIERPDPEAKTYEWDVQDFDYPELPTMVMNAIQLYRNSIGDIAAPGYDYWVDSLESTQRKRST